MNKLNQVLDEMKFYRDKEGNLYAKDEDGIAIYYKDKMTFWSFK